MTELEERGKGIYRGIVSPAVGEVTAVMGTQRVEVPAAIVPCASCHGHDGLGRAEGGLVPSNITWKALSKPYAVRRSDGRARPPYDARLLRRSFTMGLNSAGEALDPAMPRYRMTHEAAEALVAYLKRLGGEPVPGVNEDRIRLGVVLPPAGPLDRMRHVIQSAVSAYADRLNRRGGIYNRRVEIVFLTPPREAGARVAAVRSLLEQKDLFALTASYLSGADQAIAALARELEVPLIAAFNLFPDDAAPFNRYAFYVGPGLGEQARALLETAAAELRGQARRAVIVYPRDPALARVAQAMIEQASKQGGETLWSSIEMVEFEPALNAAGFADDQSRLGTNVVFLLGSERDAVALLRETRAREWRPYIFLSSPLLGDSVLQGIASYRDRIYLAFPAWTSRKIDLRAGLYGELSETYGLPQAHLSAQLSALGAVEVMAEALRLVGRDLTREKLVDALEDFGDYDTGLIPRITFGPNRRMGTLGAYVVSFGHDGARSEWVELRY